MMISFLSSRILYHPSVRVLRNLLTLDLLLLQLAARYKTPIVRKKKTCLVNEGVIESLEPHAKVKDDNFEQDDEEEEDGQDRLGCNSCTTTAGPARQQHRQGR